MKNKTHTEDCLDANDDTSVLKGKCICPKSEVQHMPTPLNEIEGVMKPFIVKYGYSKQDLLFPNGEHVFFRTLRDASRTLLAVNAYEELLWALKRAETWILIHETNGTIADNETYWQVKEAIAKAEGK